jgi:hypothetical protein
MNAECPTLTNESIKQQAGLLRHLVILCEQLLKLVDNQQCSRHPFRWLRSAESSEILNARRAKEITAPAKFSIQSAQDRQSELAVAFDGDDAGMR